jgi:hypothetical protein
MILGLDLRYNRLMARKISLKLARLIRERAYTSGALVKAGRRMSILRKEMEEAERQYTATSAYLAEIDIALAKHPSIQPNRIRPIEPSPRRLELRHGAFSQEIVRYMRTSEQPVCSGALLNHLCDVFSMSKGDTPSERKWLLCKLRHSLRAIEAKGAIQRLHERKTTKAGLWLWIGG